MRPHIGAAALLFASAACGALDHFEHTMTDEATIPGSDRMMIPMSVPYAVGYNGSFNGADLSKSESFSNAGVDPNDVDAIFVKAVRFEGTRAMIDRLDVILNSVVIWVEAPGVDRQPVASKYVFERSNQTALDIVSVDGNAINLKPYAVQPSMTIGTDVNVKLQPAFDTTLRTTITLLIDINLPGL